MKNSNIMSRSAFLANRDADSTSMTYFGVITKSMAALLMLTAAAAFAWFQNYSTGILVGVILVAFAFAMITIRNPKIAFYTTPVYAICEGIAIGAISRACEAQFNGIILTAVLLTLAIAVAVILLHSFKIIRVTESFVKIVVGATGGIALFYFVALIAAIYGINIPLIHSTGWVGILISLFITAIAAMNLVLDLEMVEVGVKSGSSKYMEWFCAMSIMITIVWIYLEVLKLALRANGSKK